MLLERVQRGKMQFPPRILVYGTEGIGKSTLAAGAPHPLFIQTEDGLAHLECERLPLSKSIEDVLQALAELNTAQHDYQSVVIDSLDWLERLIWDAVCRDFPKTGNEYLSIEKVDGGYARGYTHALHRWRQVITGLDKLREKGMMVILLAHARAEKYQPPGETATDRYSPKLHKLATALIGEWVDAVLFATWKHSPTTTKEERNERILRTTADLHSVAKNRYALPPVLPLSWDALQAAMFPPEPK